VLTHVFWIISAACVFAALYYCLAAGLRNGDRAGDAEITALLSSGTQPDETRPVIAVHVRNLRVHRLRLGPVSYPAAGRDERFPSATLR
jgi:hypothetical protein